MSGQNNVTIVTFMDYIFNSLINVSIGFKVIKLTKYIFN